MERERDPFEPLPDEPPDAVAERRSEHRPGRSEGGALREDEAQNPARARLRGSA